MIGASAGCGLGEEGLSGASTCDEFMQTNPIESTFATVRHRSKLTRGPGSRAAGLAMAFKLLEAAQDRWRAVNAPHLVALVRAGAVFERGKLVNDPTNRPPPRLPKRSSSTGLDDCSGTK